MIAGRQIKLEDLRGKSLAIDAFNTLYQFLTIIRDRYTGQPLRDSKGRITSHLSGLFYRTARFILAGLRPVYVFDGEMPVFKALAVEERSLIRAEAEKRWAAALAAGKPEEALKAAKMSARLTDPMIVNSKELLDLLGVPWVQAPSEGEAQCANMAAKGMVWASASQDVDSLLFGSPRLVRNLSISGRRKLPGKAAYYEILPELIDLRGLLHKLGINRKQLIMVGLLTGTDYNPGIFKIGPKTALKIVKKEKTLDGVLKAATKKYPWEGPPAKDILEFYLHPPVKDVKIMFGRLQPRKLLRFMVDEYEFSAERIEKVIKALQAAGWGQRSLGHWC